MHFSKIPKKNKLRKLARGRECEIRLPGICNGDPDTVVLCHLPGGGMGAKSHDLHAAYGCSACHAVVDGHSNSDYPKELLKLWFLDAVIRTQQILIREGVIKT